MNQYEARKAILQRWMTQWPTSSGSVPFVFDDDPFQEVSLYARVAVQFHGDQQQTLGQIGARRFRREGTVMVTLKSPATVGTKQSDQLVAAVRTTIETQRLAAGGTEEGVFTFTTVPDDAFTDGQYWILALTTPFAYYEVR